MKAIQAIFDIKIYKPHRLNICEPDKKNPPTQKHYKLINYFLKRNKKNKFDLIYIYIYILLLCWNVQRRLNCIFRCYMTRGIQSNIATRYSFAFLWQLRKLFCWSSTYFFPLSSFPVRWIIACFQSICSRFKWSSERLSVEENR